MAFTSALCILAIKLSFAYLLASERVLRSV